MRQRTSIFDAPGINARPRVIAPRSLAVFTVVVAAVFVLMVPNPTLERRAIESRRGDLLTVSYLANLLRTDPDDPELRFALARQQLARNETDAARATLRPLLDSTDPRLRADSHWRDWLSYREAWSRLPDTSPLRPALHKAMIKRLHELAAEPWPEEMTVRIAADAFALGERQIGTGLIKALARRPGASFDAGWYAESARTVLDAGDYRGAAALYLVARQRATGLAARRQHYLAALHALQAGNLLDEAIATAERELGDLADDTETLYAVVVLARACNRPDVADRLARRMLRLSLLDQLRRRQLAEAGLDGGLLATAGTAAAAPAGAPGTLGLPFDERIYSLAYDAFLGNRNLADAFRVADSAVRQRPDDLAWRERLAKVAEWHGQPRIALDQWLLLARRDGRREAWEAVLRLAPGLTDDEALVAALEWDARQRPLDLARLSAVVDTYERLGRTRDALAFLQARAGGQAPAAVLEALEQLAERAGEIELAIATLGRLEARLGPDPRRAERLVALLMREGRGREAFAALDRARPRAAGDDKAFWRLHAELAAFIEDNAAARDSLRRVVDFDDATETEFTRYLDLVRAADPAAAGPVAERAWRRFGRIDQLKRVLDLYAEAGREADIARVLGQLTPAQLREAEQDARFLAQRGRHHQLAGRRAAAAADYQQALTLQPEAEGVREALLWMLIDGNDAPTLRSLLARHEDTWAAEESLHDALAAAWQALSRPQRALDRYYTPRLRQHRDDFLWMLAYADALEQNGDTDRAWRLREALLRQERRPAQAEPTPEQLDQVRRLARLRLARSQNPGDPAHALLRELLRLDRAPDAPLSPAARELVLAWFIDQGQMEGVRGFLWHQYGKSLARPLWAETTAALGNADPREAARLLEQWDERLPRYDRVNLARLAGTPAIAATAAFEAMDLQRDDETSHLQLTEVMLDQADRADLDLAQRQLGSIDETFTGARLDLALAPRLRLAVELGRVSRQIIDRNYFSALPGLEALAIARLDWMHDDGTTRLAIGRRDSYAGYTPVLVEREQRLNRHLSLTATLGRDQPATENAALRVAGLRQQAGLGLTVRLSVRDQLNLRFDDYRYTAQNGLPIGRARQTQLEYAHAFRTELSDLVGSAFASSYDFEGGVDTTDARAIEIKQRLFATTPVDAAALAPSSFNLYGLRLSTNTRHITDYTRALRPIGSVGLLHNSVVGAGYDYSLGLAGSVLGNDHFSALLREDKGGTGTYAKTRQFALHYRYLF